MSTPRSEFEVKYFELISQYSQQFSKLSQLVADRVLELLAEGVDLNKAVSQALQENNFFGRNKDVLMNVLFQSAAYGYGVEPDKISKPVEVKRILLHEVWAPDKMNLSKRLHGASKEMRQEIIDTISTSMRQQKTVLDMARDLYDGYNSGQKVINKADLPEYLDRLQRTAKRLAQGDTDILREFNQALKEAKRNIDKLAEHAAPTKALKAAYSELVDAAETLNQKALGKSVRTAVEEKSRYLAERIARTESSSAWGEAFFAKHQDDPDVIAYRWALSSRHPRFDICDLHANADFYGLGKGVYPKNKFPRRPAHPHCMCLIEPIYIGEIELDPHKEAEILKKAKFNPQAMEELLQSLPRDKQLQLFGEYGLKVWRRGEDWQQHLRLWAGHEDAKGRLSPESFLAKSPEPSIINLKGDYSQAYEQKLLDVASAFKSAGLSYPKEHALNRIVSRISQGRVPGIETIIEAAKNGDQYVTPKGDIARVGSNIDNQKAPYFSVHFNSEGDIITVSPRKKSVLDKWSRIKDD